MENVVLLVEDDAFIKQMYSNKIEELGISVILASNYDEVKNILLTQKESVNLILLDLVLPNVSGFDILEWLKKDSNLKKIPVVVLSNLSSQVDIEHAFKLGAVDYIVKSNYTPSEVMHTVQKHLSNNNV